MTSFIPIELRLYRTLSEDESMSQGNTNPRWLDAKMLVMRAKPM
jgi:hypothetical protein